MIKTDNLNELHSILKDKQVYIFDFDGTLANTELYHWEAYNICLKEYNVLLTRIHIQKYIGNKESIIYDMIKKDFNIEFNNESFFNKRISIFLELIKKHELLPYDFFNNILENYSNVNYSIVSSQKAFVIEEILNIWGMRKHFNKVISVSDSEIEKYDIYSNTKKYFYVNQKDVVLFEDSNKYLSMAMENNITSIGVESNYNKNLLQDCNAIIKVNDD